MRTLGYDNADRMLSAGTAAGVVYDAWGRITSLPAGLTSTPASTAATTTYYANDLVASLSQGGPKRSWALDPTGRLASMTSTGLGSTALVNHYGDASSDSPVWTTDTAASGTVTTRRYVTGFAGLLAEVATTGTTTTTSVQLTGLHGDVLRTTTPAAAASPDGPGLFADEYGQILNPETGTITTGPRYGWLGGKQRPTDTGSTGRTLMGVRLYSPVTGRFLSTDPVYGGNANTYIYSVAPINLVDLDGRCWAHIGWLCGAWRGIATVETRAIGWGVRGVIQATGGQCGRRNGMWVCAGGVRLYVSGASGMTLGNTFVTGRYWGSEAKLDQALRDEKRHV